MITNKSFSRIASPETCLVSLPGFITVVTIYKDLLKHGDSYSVVGMALVETLEPEASAAARRKAQEKR